MTRGTVLTKSHIHYVNTEYLAEGEGFEPPEPFPVQWFSRPPPSTTRPSLRVEKLGQNSRGLAAGISHQNARPGGIGLGRFTRSLCRTKPSARVSVTPSVIALTREPA